MPRFAYAALETDTGREVRGALEALDPRAAANDLRMRRLLPIEIKEERAAPSRRRSGLAITRTRDVIFLFQQLALMQRAGLTILQALDVARAQTPKPGLAAALERMKARVEGGASLSDAFAAEPRYVPPLAAKLARAAESAGELDVTLDRIADYLQRRLEMRQSILTTLLYPALVVIATTGVFVFLVTSVFPKLARFIQGRGRALPPATQLLLDVNAFLQAHGLKVALLAFVAAAGVVLLRQRPPGRLLTDKLLLRIPVIGNVLTIGAMAQLSTTLAMLLRGGVPLLEALRISSTTLLSSAIALDVERAAEAILRGGDLTKGLDSPHVPPLVAQVVATGERTGSLELVLEELGRFYEAELARTVKRLSSLFEPAIIACVGGAVGFVYIAFFQALYSVAAGGAR